MDIISENNVAVYSSNMRWIIKQYIAYEPANKEDLLIKNFRIFADFHYTNYEMCQ